MGERTIDDALQKDIGGTFNPTDSLVVEDHHFTTDGD